MLLFRAINYNDLANYNNGNDIYSSLINSFLLSRDNNKEIRKNVYEYFKLCFNLKREYALDTIVGHISGKRLEANISPWISVSQDFNFVASEYSIPQAGKYNFIRERKPILVIDIPNDKILRNKETILKLRNNSDINDFIIDLRDDNLNTLYNSKAIISEKYNKDMPGYDVNSDFNNSYYNIETSVNGFSNYATAVKELLVYAGIRRNYIKAILSEELVDILYAIDIDINNSFIIDNYESLNSYLKSLNDPFIGKNLIDYLLNNYNDIKGNNIEEKYNNLKEIKIERIKQIINNINSKYNKDYKVSKLLDSEILVMCYENINNLTQRSKHDLLLIEKDNKIYKHNFSKKGYYNSFEESVITTLEVKEIIKTKKLKKN